MTINDIGPKPQSFNIEHATKENTDYRSVAWSGRYLQVTLMRSPSAGILALKHIQRRISSCASTLAVAGCRWEPRKTN